MSNVRLGVYDRPEHVPLAVAGDAGVPVALGADDPLLFGSRLVAQYEVARTALGFSDADAGRAGPRPRYAAPAHPTVRTRLLAGIDAWLAAPPP
jgi:adenosine deaminase